MLSWRLRNVVRRIAPEAVLTQRIRRQQERLRKRLGIPELARRYIDAYGSHVASGFAAGVSYPQELPLVVDAPIAKLLGSYEAELTHVLEEAMRYEPLRFVDIGCAEGYYLAAVGNRDRAIKIDAFELDPVMRFRARRLLRQNGNRSRLRIHGRATEDSLLALDLRHAFLICDCEGYEAQLFTSAVVDRLHDSTALIEVHDNPASDRILNDLVARFSKSHRYRIVESTQRDPGDYPALAAIFSRDEVITALSEFRPQVMKWLWLVPHTAARAGKNV